MSIDIKKFKALLNEKEKLRALLNEKQRMINECRVEIARLNKLLQSTKTIVYKDPAFTTHGEND